MPRKALPTKQLEVLSANSRIPSSITPLQTLEVQQAASEMIREACKRIGMGLPEYLTAIKDGLKAVKTYPATENNDGWEEPDHGMRLKAASMGLEVSGYLKAKGDGDVVNNYFDVKALVQMWKEVK